MARRAKELNNQAGIAIAASSVTIYSKVPIEPEYMNSEQKKIWTDTCETLIDANRLARQLLSGIERHVLARYLVRLLAKEKKIKPTVLTAALEQLRRTEVDLGLNISGFVKVKIPKSKVVEFGESQEVSSELRSRMG